MNNGNFKRTGLKNLSLFVVVSMSFMATLDSSIVNVALPVLSKKLAVSLSSVEWIIAGYSIVICATLLFFGRLGDIVGKVKVFQSGTVVFTIGSLLCSLCHTFVPLVICRIVQGVGAAAYMANNQGIITELFSSEERGKALGFLAAAVALGTMAGPPVGGFIISVLSWNDIFLVNVPVGIVVFLMGRRYLPANTGSGGTFDIKGAVCQFAATALFFCTLIRAQKTGFAHPVIILMLILSVISFLLFTEVEKKCVEPMVDSAIFKNHLFTISLVCAFISFVCIAASTILLPFYLQNTLKFSPWQTGVLLMLAPVIIAVLSPVCGTLADRVGAEAVSVIGLVLMCAGFILMSLLNESSPLVLFCFFMGVMATGQAAFQPANNSLIMSNCPHGKLGVGGSLNSLVRNLGQISGISVATTLLYLFMSHRIGYRVSDYITGRDDVFVYGMRNDYLILACICAVGAALTIIRLHGKSCSNVRNR